MNIKIGGGEEGRKWRRKKKPKEAMGMKCCKYLNIWEGKITKGEEGGTIHHTEITRAICASAQNLRASGGMFLRTRI
jgi:hypothetical protein